MLIMTIKDLHKQLELVTTERDELHARLNHEFKNRFDKKSCS